MSLSLARLELLYRLAEKREQDALNALAQAQKKLATQQATQRELQGYLAGYQGQAPRGNSVQMLLNQRAFNAKLGQAVEAQLQTVHTVAAQVQEQQAAWQESLRARRTAQHLLDQARLEQGRVAERRAQRDTDEFAARALLRPAAY